MVLLIRRVWTGVTLVAVVSAFMAGAPDIMSVDAQTGSNRENTHVGRSEQCSAGLTGGLLGPTELEHY